MNSPYHTSNNNNNGLVSDASIPQDSMISRFKNVASHAPREIEQYESNQVIVDRNAAFSNAPRVIEQYESNQVNVNGNAASSHAPRASRGFSTFSESSSQSTSSSTLSSTFMSSGPNSLTSLSHSDNNVDYLNGNFDASAYPLLTSTNDQDCANMQNSHEMISSAGAQTDQDWANMQNSHEMISSAGAQTDQDWANMQNSHEMISSAGAQTDQDWANMQNSHEMISSAGAQTDQDWANMQNSHEMISSAGAQTDQDWANMQNSHEMISSAGAQTDQDWANMQNSHEMISSAGAQTDQDWANMQNSHEMISSAGAQTDQDWANMQNSHEMISSAGAQTDQDWANMQNSHEMISSAGAQTDQDWANMQNSHEMISSAEAQTDNENQLTSEEISMLNLLIKSLQISYLTPPSANSGCSSWSGQAGGNTSPRLGSPLVDIPLGYGTAHSELNSSADPREATGYHHNVAASVKEMKVVWRGRIPVRIHQKPKYSSKVFLGGVSHKITEEALVTTFSKFGEVDVQYRYMGHAYLIFESDSQVKALLSACTPLCKGPRSCLYYMIPTSELRERRVQVVPWLMNNKNYPPNCLVHLDAKKSVFVGRLHGTITAEALFNIMNELFGGVLHAVINTDLSRYPTGSGRVTFRNQNSYRSAVASTFIQVITEDFRKTIQVDPFLEESPCSLCNNKLETYFCRETSCLNYFCHSCWKSIHSPNLDTYHHKPLTLNSNYMSANDMSSLSPPKAEKCEQSGEIGCN